MYPFKFLLRDCGGHFRTLENLFNFLGQSLKINSQDKQALSSTLYMISDNLPVEKGDKNELFNSIKLALKGDVTSMNNKIVDYIAGGFLKTPMTSFNTRLIPWVPFAMMKSWAIYDGICKSQDLEVDAGICN